jgi:hypothetical protein
VWSIPDASCPRVLLTVIFSPATNSRISSFIIAPPPPCYSGISAR